jgi:hypothetical protein
MRRFVKKARHIHGLEQATHHICIRVTMAHCHQRKVVSSETDSGLRDNERQPQLEIFLGGVSSERGFTQGGIAGDSGFYIRNEAAWQNVPVWRGARIEPSVFLDSGKSHLISQGGWPTLVGAGVGTRLQWRFKNQTISSEVLLGQLWCRAHPAKYADCPCSRFHGPDFRRQG